MPTKFGTAVNACVAVGVGWLPPKTLASPAPAPVTSATRKHVSPSSSTAAETITPTSTPLFRLGWSSGRWGPNGPEGRLVVGERGTVRSAGPWGRVATVASGSAKASNGSKGGGPSRLGISRTGAGRPGASYGCDGGRPIASGVAPRWPRAGPLATAGPPKGAGPPLGTGRGSALGRPSGANWPGRLAGPA